MAKVVKRGRHWVADFKDETGKLYRLRPAGPFENSALEKIAAQELLTKRIGEIHNHKFVPPAARKDFSTLADDWLRSKVNVRAKTARGYRSVVDAYLRPYFGAAKIEEITTAAIERFRSELRVARPKVIADAAAGRSTNPGMAAARAKSHARKPGPRTVNKVLTVMVMIFNYAKKHEWVERNPAEFVEKVKSRDGNSPVDQNILSPAEVARLIDAAAGPRRDAKGNLISNNYRLLIELAVWTGMRQGEVLGAQWGDIDWNTSQLYVRRAWTDGRFNEPKTPTSIRRVDLPKPLLNELRAWKLACPKGGDDLIVSNLDGRPMSHANLLQRGFYPALRRAGLRKIRFHDLRHTFASLQLARGADVVRVSRMLGHASPAITLNVYSHMLPKEHYGDADALYELVRGANDPALVDNVVALKTRTLTNR